MYVVGITGASGVIYGIRLIEELIAAKKCTAAIATKTALQMMSDELFPGESFASVSDVLFRRGIEASSELFIEYDNSNLYAPIASGSFHFEGIIVAPCSMKTLAQLSCGYADSLLTRAFDVALKEKRKAVIVPRETPLSSIHLENMLRLAREGVVILPPASAFYSKPQTVDDMINFVVGKILQTLGIEHTLFRPWGTS